jgi:hypothetical protein
MSLPHRHCVSRGQGHMIQLRAGALTRSAPTLLFTRQKCVVQRVLTRAFLAAQVKWAVQRAVQLVSSCGAE